MSKRRHRSRDHRGVSIDPTAWDDPDADVCTQIAATIDATDESIEEAKHVSHDQLVRQLGRRRRSGVRWAVHGPDERDAALVTMSQTATKHTNADGSAAFPEDPYADVRAWFDEYPGGVLVVAMAVAS